MHFSPVRIASAVALAGAVCLLLPPARSAGQQPTLPIVPAPLPPPGPHPRLPQLVPGSVWVQKDAPIKGGEKAEAKDKNGDKTDSDPTRAVETGPELSLGECVGVAIERSPRLKAVRDGIQSSEAGYRALMNFGTVGTLLSPDLQIRKQQAERGLGAAAGEYQKEFNEVVHDVTRMYYSAVYAKQQEAIADDVVGRLAELVDLARELLNNPKVGPDDLKGLTTGKLYIMETGLAEAKIQRLYARQGRKQALAALRQVMAVDGRTFPFRVKDVELPVMRQENPITKELVVDLAMTRRPELALAAAGVDVFRLEVYAQSKIPCKRVVPTFASGADIHSKEIPQTQRGKDYRPGGIVPDMPTQLVGSKFDRVCRARALSQRADAVYESAQTLVRLEAENGFIEFELATEKLRLAKDKYDAGVKLQKLTEAAAGSPNAGKDALVQGFVAAAKAQSDYVEAVWQHLLALAALERITAGGIRPDFPGR